MNLYKTKLKDLQQGEIPLAGLTRFALANYEPVPYDTMYGNMNGRGNGKLIIGTDLGYDKDYDNLPEGHHVMYFKGVHIGWVPTKSIGKVVALFENPAKWFKHLAKQYAEDYAE
jgi:hypothetical protein